MLMLCPAVSSLISGRKCLGGDQLFAEKMAQAVHQFGHHSIGFGCVNGVDGQVVMLGDQWCLPGPHGQ